MFNVYIGKRGVGKSSYAAKLAYKYSKKGFDVYCNFPLKCTFYYSIDDLGKYDISNAVLILDEAGIDMNNRAYKSLDKSIIKWFKLSRHYGVKDIFVFSQAFDFDITLRRLADNMYIMRKSLIPHCSVLKPLHCKWSIDDDGQPTLKWVFVPLLFRFFFRYPYYKYFDSYDAPCLVSKEFQYFDNNLGKPYNFKLFFFSLKSKFIFLYNKIKIHFISFLSKFKPN